jgi:hypothetical protein
MDRKTKEEIIMVDRKVRIVIDVKDAGLYEDWFSVTEYL